MFLLYSICHMEGNFVYDFQFRPICQAPTPTPDVYVLLHWQSRHKINLAIQPPSESMCPGITSTIIVEFWIHVKIKHITIKIWKPWETFQNLEARIFA